MKKIFSLILVLLIAVLVSGCSKQEESIKNESSNVVNEENKNVPIETTAKEDEILELEEGWNFYKNYKYGFELPFPSDWELRKTSASGSEENNQFLFDGIEAGVSVHVYILPQGGYGHGRRILDKKEGEFKGKKAETYWGLYSFPEYVFISEDLPERWMENNSIEFIAPNISKSVQPFLEQEMDYDKFNSSEIQEANKIFERIYREFTFIE